MSKSNQDSALQQGHGISKSELLKLQASADEVASYIRLSFNSTTWRGTGGSWQGVGIGSSVDFQDHRQYLPGDDPRYINWQAYARTGHYTMKLYREEVSPQVDLVLDVSKSMFVHADKAQRVIELFHFIAASAARAGASLSCYQAGPSGARSVDLEAVLSGQWDLIPEIAKVDKQNEIPMFNAVPWRHQALRILVSDLLFAGAPEALLSEVAPGNARLWTFCPWCDAEQSPDWLGNVELKSCETATKCELRITDREVEAYQKRYAQHFSLWQEASARRGFGFARVDSTTSLQDSLLKESLSYGLVELWN